MIATNQRAKRSNASYAKIADLLRLQIQEGALGPGTMIPSVRRLADSHGVTLGTAQQAVRDLVAEGLLYSEDRRGTFVATRLPSFVASSAPSRREPPLIAHSASLTSGLITVGVIASNWRIDNRFVDEDDRWPSAILRAFECATASTPNVVLKFREGGVNSIKALLDEGIHGLAVVFPQREEIEFIERCFDTSRVPVVTMMSSGTFGSLPRVYYDNRFAGFQAAHHLIDRGYKNISLFCPFTDDDWIVDRRQGAVEALRKSGLGLADQTARFQLVAPNTFSREHPEIGYEAARHFLQHGLSSWGIIAVNDNVAYGLLKAAAELGMRAGIDFGLVGFDDRSLSRVHDMTSLHPPLEAIGVEASKLLFEHMNGNRLTQEVRLRSQLVTRSSTQIHIQHS